MGEYGSIVGESSGTGGGRGGGGGGGGSFDLVGDVMGALSDLLDQIVALPPEMLVLLAAVVMVGGFVLSTRTS